VAVGTPSRNTLCQVVDNFVSKGTTVNIRSVDLSRAFDKVDYYALFIKLMKRQFPVQLLDRLLLSICYLVISHVLNEVVHAYLCMFAITYAWVWGKVPFYLHHCVTFMSMI